MPSPTPPPAILYPNAEYSVRAHGAVGDGITLDTDAINRAIRAAHAAGGGTVTFPAGDYLSHSIRLLSHVVLHLGPGATLIAANPPQSPGEPGYDPPEPREPNLYQDFGHSYFHNSLIWGEGLSNVGITGPGRIFGRGLSRGNGPMALPVGEVAPQPAGRLPDVLEADGEVPPNPNPQIKPGAFGYPHAFDTLPAGVGNKAIALLKCRGVQLTSFSVLHGGHFAVLLTACDNVLVDGVTVDTNRDGIDVDSCSNVRVARCSVNSPWDDGICLKASCADGMLRLCENVTISDCFVSGFKEGTLLDGTRVRTSVHRGGPIGRIKLGTESSGGYRNVTIANCVFDFCRGLALEQVDGGVMENILVSNLVLHDCQNAPVFIRLGARGRSPVRRDGTARRIIITNLVAYDVSADHGILVLGSPDLPVEDVTISNIELHSRGGGTRDDANRRLPEMVDGYPEPYLFGRVPSWGIFVRHARRIRLSDVNLHLLKDDERPAIWGERIDELTLDHVRAPLASDGKAWRFIRCTGTTLYAGESRRRGHKPLEENS